MKFFKRVFKKQKIIDELIKRRNEVIKRAQSPIPDEFLQGNFNLYLMWLIEPHIKESFEPYKERVDPKTERKIHKTVYNIMEEAIKDGDIQEKE